MISVLILTIGMIIEYDGNFKPTDHGEEHLWPEHPTVADLHPLVKTRVEGKDLHTEGAQIRYWPGLNLMDTEGAQIKF